MDDTFHHISVRINMARQDKKIGRYTLRQKIGSGSSGDVYLASVKGPFGVDKKVALKMLHPSVGSDNRRRDDFINEARLGALLKHPNIVEVYELGALESHLFIAMEFIDGYSLRFMLDQQPNLPENIALRITKDVAQGLKYAGNVQYQGNELQLVHRDLKPANILVNRQGQSKIVDFGLARALGISELTDGGLQGTLNYMSPEQARGDSLDFRSDIFSLGLILYEMICGERVFDNRHHYSLIIKVQEIDTLWKEKLHENLKQRAPGLIPILRKMLSLYSKSRYQSYDHLILDIENRLLNKGTYRVQFEQQESGLPIEPSQEHDDESSVSVIIDDRSHECLGREKEKEALQLLVENNQLVQVKGSIGIGKTAFVQSFLSEERRNYDRALYVPLEKTNTKISLTGTVFRALALTAPSGDGVEELLNYFRVVQRFLLVVDLDEPISEETLSVLKYWITHIPQLRIIVCSHTLIEPNIQYLDIPPLQNQVVVQYIQKHCKHLSSKQIEQLLPYIEGIPLLMVMTVAQLKKHTFGDFVKKQSLLSPDSGWFSRMDILWDLLAPYEQNALCQLSVFEGYFSIHAAEKVIDLKDHNIHHLTIDVLGSLVSHSLLHTKNDRGEIMFRLSRRINNFVRKHFNKQQYQETCKRHAEFYAFSTQIYLQKNQLIRFYYDQELNFSRAIRKSVQYGWTDLAIRCVLTWQDCVGKLNIPYSLFSLLAQIVNNPDVSPIGRAELQFISGQQLRLRGKYLESVRVLLEAQKTFEHYRREDRVADVRCSLCVTYTELARYFECNEVMKQALAYARASSDIKREAIYLKDYGYSLSQQGKLDEALRVLETSAKQLLQLGEPVHAFAVCSNLGLVQLRRNQIDRASHYFHQAIKISRKGYINDKIDMIWMNIGICAVLQGDIQKAEKAFSKAAKQMKKVGALRSLAILYANWGKLRMLQEKYEDAEQLVQQSHRLCLHHPHPITEHTLSMVRVSLSLFAGEPKKSLNHWRRAMDIVEENQYTFKLVETLSFGVEIYSRMGAFDKAQDRFFEAKDASKNGKVDSFWLCYAQAQFSKHKQNTKMYAAAYNRAQELIKEYFPTRADIRFYFDQLRYLEE